MPGKWKIVLSVIIVLATASSASAARCRMIAAGPEWYLDDLSCWHSIRADWAGIQRHGRARRRASTDYGSNTGER
jgi:hypothetical protein